MFDFRDRYLCERLSQTHTHSHARTRTQLHDMPMANSKAADWPKNKSHRSAESEGRAQKSTAVCGSL